MATGLMVVNEIEQVLINGDLSKLQPAQRLAYYKSVCESLGLNPLTKPFDYIVLNGKLTLYAKRDCTDQLRKIHRVSITRLERELIDDIYTVVAHATDKDGRTDTAIGAVNVKGLSGDAKANAIMKAECVPLDSEILTRGGFRKYNEIEIGEEVLAYDCDTDRCIWTPLQSVTVYDSLPMARLYSDKGQFEVFCTPDHSWAVTNNPYRPRPVDGSRGKRGPYKNRKPNRLLIEAQKINAGHRLILAAPEEEQHESPLTATEAAILGWAVTDGTIQKRGSHRRVGICQSKEENFETIRGLVRHLTGGVKESVFHTPKRTFPMTGRTYETKEQHWWYLPAQVSRDLLREAGFESRADLPKLVTRLSSSARKAMLQAFMLAEGDKRDRFANGDPHILETFQILCALEGIAVGKQIIKDTIFTIRMKKTKHVAGSFLNIETVEAAPVWCPTTRYGTWVMRQNGRVMITGNTKSKRRVTLSIVGLGWLDETEIETIPDVKTNLVDVQTGEVVEIQTKPDSRPVAPIKPADGNGHTEKPYRFPSTASRKFFDEVQTATGGFYRDGAHLEEVLGGWFNFLNEELYNERLAYACDMARQPETA